MTLAERKKIARIISSSLLQLTSEKEETELQRWVQEKEENRRMLERLKEGSYSGKALSEFGHYRTSRDWKQVKSRITKRKRQRLWRRQLAYAALVAFLLGLGSIFYYLNTPTHSRPSTWEEPFAPGGTKALLTLSDGSHIELPETTGLSQEKHLEENLIHDGKQLVYTPPADDRPEKNHILQTPRGGEYHLTLSDGTQVWVNAASSLSYPDHFSGEERRVKLDGEAYFEVSHDTAKPFIVEVSDLTVRVLGTSFNVSAYREEEHRATLVTGRVSVSSGEETREIKPGEQALLTPQGFSVFPVDITNYVSWKERRFVYKNKPLKEIFRDLERWYDVSIIFLDDEIEQLKLTANLPKYENMDKILEVIEYIACVKCDITDRTVTVKSDK